MANQEGRLDLDIDDNETEELVDLGVSTESEDTGARGYEDYARAQESEAEEQVEEESLPDKYRGKDVKDIIAMHQNAEKLVGKQSQEVGELRRVVDDFIRTQTLNNNNQAPQTETYEVDELDFFEDPKKAVAQMLESHPSVVQSKQLAMQLAQQEALAQLKGNHPDFETIIQNQGFLEWVQKSKIRTELLRKADQQYDYESANELFSLWKERQGMVNDTITQETRARKQSVKTASTGNVKGSSERSGRKIYRRADIVELMTKDPERYQTLASEIRQAYAEGRVR